MRFEALNDVPNHLLRQWSEATQHEEHLAAETPESLARNLKLAVVAFDQGYAIGFAGLIVARTAQGHGIVWQGLPVIELGGAYIQQEYRGAGIWRRLLELRLDYARRQDWCVVCITGNPTVQSGLSQLGARNIVEPALRQQLCMQCEGGCTFCPLAEGTAWRVL